MSTNTDIEERGKQPSDDNIQSLKHAEHFIKIYFGRGEHSRKNRGGGGGGGGESTVLGPTFVKCVW